MKNEIIKRLKSPVVWGCVVAQLVLIIAVFNPTTSETVKSIATPIIEILTLFGILNNPTDRGNF